MGLGNFEALSITKKHIELLKHKKPGVPVRTALLGYQYVIATLDEARFIVGENNLSSLLVVVKSDAAGYGIRTKPLDEYLRGSFSSGLDYLNDNQIFFETFSFFKALGCHCQAFDLVPLEGLEICIDLNTPIPSEFHGKFDLVIDSGTLEHCFHPGEGMKNIVRMLDVDGIAIHYAPIILFNHGYYNFTPEVFTEFYKANNFIVLDSMYFGGFHRRTVRADVFEEKLVGIVVQKTRRTNEIKVPVQLVSRRYVDFPQTYTYGPLFRASRSPKKVGNIPSSSDDPFYDALLRQFSLVCDPEEVAEIAAREELQGDCNGMMDHLERILVRESKKFLADEIKRISGKEIYFWVLDQQIYDRFHDLFNGSRVAACISRDDAVDTFEAHSKTTGLPFISCKRAASEFSNTPIVIFGSLRDAHFACQDLLKVRQDIQFDVIFCW